MSSLYGRLGQTCRQVTWLRKPLHLVELKRSRSKALPLRSAGKGPGCAEVNAGLRHPGDSACLRGDLGGDRVVTRVQGRAECSPILSMGPSFPPQNQERIARPRNSRFATRESFWEWPKRSQAKELDDPDYRSCFCQFKFQRPMRTRSVPPAIGPALC
jgi:hypothetical protein